MIENKTQKMTWNNYLALLFLFRSNAETSKILDWIGAIPPEFKEYILL